MFYAKEIVGINCLVTTGNLFFSIVVLFRCIEIVQTRRDFALEQLNISLQNCSIDIQILRWIK